jgi:transposase
LASLRAASWSPCSHQRLASVCSFLIVDRGPAHVAKKTKAFVASLGGRLGLFYLPPYSPQRNPDELVCKHLKADTIERTFITSFLDFKSNVRSSMLSLQRSPAKIRAFSYAA